MHRRLLAALAVAIGLFAMTRGQETSPPRLRRPIALALVDAGKHLLIANRDAGTVAILDPANAKVVQELRVGRRLSDLAVTADGRRVAVTDEAAGELIVLERTANELRE